MYELHRIKELLAFLVTYSLNNDIIIMMMLRPKMTTLTVKAYKSTYFTLLYFYRCFVFVLCMVAVCQPLLKYYLILSDLNS